MHCLHQCKMVCFPPNWRYLVVYNIFRKTTFPIFPIPHTSLITQNFFKNIYSFATLLNEIMPKILYLFVICILPLVLSFQSSSFLPRVRLFRKISSVVLKNAVTSEQFRSIAVVPKLCYAENEVVDFIHEWSAMQAETGSAIVTSVSIYHNVLIFCIYLYRIIFYYSPLNKGSISLYNFKTTLF